jgi:copper(I)-binding protein
MNKVSLFAKQCLVLVTLLWSTTSLAEESFTISNAWVPEAPPKAEVSAAYLTIQNQTNHAHTLVGISSPQFQKTELHESKTVDGQERMQRIKTLAIEAHGSVELKPGGYHLMLIKPLQPLKAGGTVELKLQFDDASQITVQAPIRKIGDADKAPHHHDMSDMKM